jgi:ADP-heptose:LPS heptosyltransferase
MPRRQRWTPLRGTGNRVYDAKERLVLGALDLPGRAIAAVGRVLGGARPVDVPPRDAVREVLVLRLDRIGDVLMCLPALADLRRALPRARIRLAVGGWSAAIARGFPVDEVLVWSAPWAGRRDEGTASFARLAAEARAVRRDRIDLGIDLQGDVRAALLLRSTGARVRVGYANTGGAYLLTHVVPLDETVSWVEQNRRAVAVAVGAAPPAPRPDPLTPEDRAFAEDFLKSEGLAERRPLVGIHPSGGRSVKQWPVDRWAEVGSRLQRAHGATIVVTGSGPDRPLAAALRAGLVEPPVDLTGRLGVRETLAVVSRLDLLLSPDTGPMHMATAVGTPSVSVFGPSDPVRYFSGREEDGGAGARHAVVRAELWCSPCNLIRKPPAECSGRDGPECLRLVDAETVYREAARVLRAGRDRV